MAKKQKKAKLKTHFVYKYTNANDCPLDECPECGHNLTEPGSITLELAINGVNQDHDSCLNSNGVLEDTPDDAVLNGFHSATYCGDCGNMLIDMPGVTEQNIAE